MNKKIIATIIGGLGLVGMTSQASAGLITPGYTIHVSNIFEYAATDSNGNGVVDFVGEVLGGMGNVQSITDTAGTQIFWQSGDANQELSYVFGGYTASAIIPTFGGFAITFTGGYADFYLNTLGTFNALGGPTPTNFATVTGGSLFFALDGSTGILGAISPTTTLFSNLTALTTPFTGSGFGHLSVDLGTLGLSGLAYDTNGILGANGELNDFSLESSFNTQLSIRNGWPVSGTASITSQAVPEPASLALIGLGLMGFAATRRKQA